MTFPTESSGYEKTILSDLQGAWRLLRDSVAETNGFSGWDRVLFHIDEAMNWESVRNLDRMPPLLTIIRNLCLQGEAPEAIMENIENVHGILEEILEITGGYRSIKRRNSPGMGRSFLEAARVSNDNNPFSVGESDAHLSCRIVRRGVHSLGGNARGDGCARCAARSKE